jgi:hypothetical protein
MLFATANPGGASGFPPISRDGRLVGNRRGMRVCSAPARAGSGANRSRDATISYPLRAADALQLAAALIWCNRHPRGKTFISGDERLLEAAEKEGFNVIRM